MQYHAVISSSMIHQYQPTNYIPTINHPKCIVHTLGAFMCTHSWYTPCMLQLTFSLGEKGTVWQFGGEAQFGAKGSLEGGSKGSIGHWDIWGETSTINEYSSFLQQVQYNQNPFLTIDNNYILEHTQECNCNFMLHIRIIWSNRGLFYVSNQASEPFTILIGPWQPQSDRRVIAHWL